MIGESTSVRLAVSSLAQEGDTFSPEPLLFSAVDDLCGSAVLRFGLSFANTQPTKMWESDLSTAFCMPAYKHHTPTAAHRKSTFGRRGTGSSRGGLGVGLEWDSCLGLDDFRGLCVDLHAMFTSVYRGTPRVDMLMMDMVAIRSLGAWS